MLHSIRLLRANNRELNFSMLHHSRTVLLVVTPLIRLESLVGEASVDLAARRAFATPSCDLCTNQFQNDDHCEN